MQLRYITADWIYPVSAPRIFQGVVVMDEDKVIALTSRDKVNADQLEFHQGIIIPGFINTHCHLELSHLHGKAPTGTGLLPFITHVVKYRDVDQDIIDEAIANADAYMWNQGIQAVGDICNKADTFHVKQESNITYYSFVEMFDFMQESLTEKLTSGNLDAYHSAPGPKSAVPHAPYSVSPGLFKQINALNDSEVTVSIHNQETQAEEDMFQKGIGGFYDFYDKFGFHLDHFSPTGMSSIHYALMHMDPSQRTLFIHNTLTTPKDISAAHHWSDKVYWATCPNANLYIESRLPYYKYFMDSDARITIGTDSLTSNWQLSILEEMKTISKYQSYVPFEALLKWATLNGAEALGMEKVMGSIDPDKTPGLLLLSFDPERDLLSDVNVQVRRIV